MLVVATMAMVVGTSGPLSLVNMISVFLARYVLLQRLHQFDDVVHFK